MQPTSMPRLLSRKENKIYLFTSKVHSFQQKQMQIQSIASLKGAIKIILIQNPWIKITFSKYFNHQNCGNNFKRPKLPLQNSPETILKTISFIVTIYGLISVSIRLPRNHTSFQTQSLEVCHSQQAQQHLQWHEECWRLRL